MAYYNKAASGAFVIAVYPRPLDKNGLVSFFYAIIDNGETIPEPYRDFEDIFSEEDTGKLP
jgi:hypothetical protein